ncbi:MAG: hypothetical protein ACR2RE_32110, partial [Geminicoccaceae bacterium]
AKALDLIGIEHPAPAWSSVFLDALGRADEGLGENVPIMRAPGLAPEPSLRIVELAAAKQSR